MTLRNRASSRLLQRVEGAGLRHRDEFTEAKRRASSYPERSGRDAPPHHPRLLCTMLGCQAKR